ncbi:MAG: site-specific integrase [Taibaiella sp.]|nr:site-specific integrase [Taibaiella sp.]
MRPKIEIYLNKYYPDKENQLPISIKVSYNRTRRYYPTGVSMTRDVYEKPKSKMEISDASYVQSCYAKAIKVVDSMKDDFSFDQFEKFFLQNAALKDSLEYAFEQYIEQMEPERVGNRQSCNEAKRSFLGYKKNATLADVTPAWLKGYEKHMDELERSKTTIGIYCRALRSVFNYAISEGRITPERYPFGKRKYEIPTGRNIKKALTLDEIKKIFEYQLPEGSRSLMYKEFWILIYLMNGINVADLLRIKRTDLKKDEVSFIREKTKRTKRQVEEIKIQLLPKALEIINKYRNKSIIKEDYLLPFIKPGMTPEEEDKVIYNYTRYINKRMKAIAKELEIEKEVTTYYARHSFATIMKNSGANIAMISQMLGHSSITTTERYFAGFEKEELKKAAAVLMPEIEAKF